MISKTLISVIEKQLFKIIFLNIFHRIIQIILRSDVDRLTENKLKNFHYTFDSSNY